MGQLSHQLREMRVEGVSVKSYTLAWVAIHLLAWLPV